VIVQSASPLAHPFEDIREPGGLVLTFRPEARGLQRGLHRPGGGLDAMLLVGEQVDILGDPVDDPVGDQGVAAAQREPVPRRRAQRDSRHLAVKVADGHQAAATATARRTGCASSHARRTPLGTNSFGHKATSAWPSRKAVRSSGRDAS